MKSIVRWINDRMVLSKWINLECGEDKYNEIYFNLSPEWSLPNYIPKKIIIGINNTKLLGLELDKNISWKNHVQKILPKLSSACYVDRRIYPCCKLNTLKLIYFTSLRAVMEYGIIFWGDSVENKRIFQQQKRIIIIMTGFTSRISFKTLLQK